MPEVLETAKEWILHKPFWLASVVLLILIIASSLARAYGSDLLDYPLRYMFNWVGLTDQQLAQWSTVLAASVPLVYVGLLAR